MKLFKTNNGSVDTIIANYAATGCRMTTGIAFSRQNDADSRVELRKNLVLVYVVVLESKRLYC